MKIVILSPYHGGSHQAWAEGYGRYSRHQIDLLTMPDRFWKWRMHGAGVTLARRFNHGSKRADLILATDMLDLTTFLALTRRRTHGTPVVLYMHENQLTYPLPADTSTGPMRRQLGERDRHYAFVNYASMLAADEIWFNSHYHLNAFYAALPKFLKHFPEYNEMGSVSVLQEKSQVMPVGIDFQLLEANRPTESMSVHDTRMPRILWNQRWEYDKNPDDFFRALDILAATGIPFEVILCGKQFGKQPAAFDDWMERLDGRLKHVGYASPDDYARLLWQADVTASTAHHEFFGISMVEAIYARTFPLLPNRLSYPELIPDEFHESCLYDNFDALVGRLEEALTDIDDTRAQASLLAPSTARFDWQNLAPQYDKHLATIAGSAA